MKWLKYQHKFSSGRSAWQWKAVDNDATEESVREDGMLDDIANEYGYSDKYSGIDFEIVDKAPQWVVLKHLGIAVERRENANREYVMYKQLLQDNTEECRQCKDATAAETAHYKQHGTGVAIKPCPMCGLDILVDTVPFWLMPDDTDAVKLLGSLVEQGQRSVKSKKFRWPVEDEDEEKAYHRLSKLGLVGGSIYQDTYEIHATKSGEAEWLKHKERK